MFIARIDDIEDAWTRWRPDVDNFPAWQRIGRPRSIRHTDGMISLDFGSYGRWALVTFKSNRTIMVQVIRPDRDGLEKLEYVAEGGSFQWVDDVYHVLEEAMGAVCTSCGRHETVPGECNDER